MRNELSYARKVTEFQVFYIVQHSHIFNGDKYWSADNFRRRQDITFVVPKVIIDRYFSQRLLVRLKHYCFGSEIDKKTVIT